MLLIKGRTMGFGEFFVALLLAGVLLIVFRVVALWYWKVNQLLETLQRIQQNTARVALILGEVHTDASAEVERKGAELRAVLQQEHS
jgi:hypothetical protein